MIAVIYHESKQYQIDLDNPMDISIPLSPGKNNVNARNAKPFEVKPVKNGENVNSVKQGGSVNIMDLSFNPHGNGTHTECVGHISEEPFTINQCLRSFYFTAELISLYPEQLENSDYVITKHQLESALAGKSPEALAIRTLPNDFFKLRKQHSGTNPAYLHHEAIEYIVEKGIKHLLVDLPSIDREDDGGKVQGHKLFWDYPYNIREEATITELIYVPQYIDDGTYILNLQIASFETDASPSKPVLYKLFK